MKYLKKEIMNSSSVEAINDAFRAYKSEFDKVKKKLPRKFIKIFEEHEYFHDAKVPEISISTKYQEVNGPKYKLDPSVIRLMIVDYRDINKKWEICLHKVKHFSCNVNISGDFFKGIEFFCYDEFLQVDDNYFSWEICFSSGCSIKTIFKKLTIKELHATDDKL